MYIPPKCTFVSFEKCLQKTFCKNSATNCEKDRPTHAYKSGASEEASQKRCQEGKKEKESILRINRYVFQFFQREAGKYATPCPRIMQFPLTRFPLKYADFGLFTQMWQNST